MNITPKFVQLKPSFHTELKKRISNYFETTGKSTSGNYKLWTKAVILISVLIALYIHLVFFTPSAVWAILECVLLGTTVASIGFNIMHDGAHGSFSKSPVLNKMAAVTLGFLGGSHFMWNVKHNIIHHAYTNIDGVDDDIDARPFLRMASTQKNISSTVFNTGISGSFIVGCICIGYFLLIIKNILRVRSAICH